MARYTAGNTNANCKVFLDGVEISYVVECDDVLGFAVVIDKDKPFTNCELPTKILIGNVVVTLAHEEIK